MSSPEATLRLNKAHSPVSVLGFGRRLGLWLQGCSIHCRGCVSQDAWDPAGGFAVPVSELIAWCLARARALDGVTLSGGEPFDQPEALALLLQGLQPLRQRGDFDLLCYSGHAYAHLRQYHAELLALLDAIIPEPYVDKLPLGKLWRGSVNQPLIPLSPLGEARYADKREAAAEKAMQIAVEHGRVWMIGIPDRDDMTALEQHCRARGLTLAQVSWRR